MCADGVRLAEMYEHRVHLELRIKGQHTVPVDVPESAGQLWCKGCCPRTEAVRRRQSNWAPQRESKARGVKITGPAICRRYFLCTAVKSSLTHFPTASMACALHVPRRGSDVQHYRPWFARAGRAPTIVDAADDRTWHGLGREATQ